MEFRTSELYIHPTWVAMAEGGSLKKYLHHCHHLMSIVSVHRDLGKLLKVTTVKKQEHA